jgi:hypothetical protein
MYGFLSNLQRMSGMAMGRDINSGVVNGCTSFARYVAINSNFHCFAFVLLFLENYFLHGCAAKRMQLIFPFISSPKSPF